MEETVIKPIRIVRRINPGTFRIEKRHVKIRSIRTEKIKNVEITKHVETP